MTAGPFVAVSAAWREAHPDARVGFLAMRGVANPARHPAIDRIKAELQSNLRERYGTLDRAALREIDPLPAYAAYYKRFGQRYHVGMQLESVAQKGKDLPDVAALVEAMFVAELRNLILTAGHDLDEVALPLRLEMGDEDEPVAFTAPNGKEISVKAGDMYVADGNGVLSAIITGPSAAARIGPGTTSVVFVAYAPPGVSAVLLGAHLDDLKANTRLVSPHAVTVGREIVGA
jgi:DNA/RNA-binding domain of Phe-tRNA-synthetase-like protein